MDKINKKSSKKKVISLDDIDSALLPGRHKCDCEASIHTLVCNCLNCGRIVCEQERESDDNIGTCYTCGENLITKQDLEEYIRKSKEWAESKQKTSQLNNRSNKKTNGPMNLKEIASSLIGIDQANQHKDQLLEYERTSEQRTKVIDDELDYFDLTRENWLSSEKREELRDKVDKLHEDKFEIDRRYELDFNTRSVVEVCVPKVKDLNEEVSKLKEETEFKSDYEYIDFKQLPEENKIEPYYVEAKKESNKKVNKKLKPNKPHIILPTISLIRNRLQDSELFGVVDEGYALSINQPWASLLIHKIKLHEGRDWPTAHRGPLWIHATAKSPRKEEIEEACALFRLMLDDKNVKFPNDYPVGKVLGRSNLIECLSHEEYQSKFGNGGYIEDKYAFVFDDIVKLEIPVPLPGRPKIFKLEKSVFKVLSSQITQTYGSKN